jgi:hypothetical protein
VASGGSAILCPSACASSRGCPGGADQQEMGGGSTAYTAVPAILRPGMRMGAAYSYYMYDPSIMVNGRV